MKRTGQHSPQSATKLSDHLGELRWRFLACLLVFAVGGFITYHYREVVFQVLQYPVKSTLYYTTPAGSLSFVMRFSTIGAMAITIPVITYHLMMFIRPAIDVHLSKMRIYVTSLGSLFLAIAGMTFGFTIILPASLNFFSGFQIDGLESLISADSYLNLVANILVIFAITFQIPLIISLIDRITPLKLRQLLKAEKWVILGSLIVSVLVPFAWDFTTSLLIAAPIVVLYNLSIILVLLQHIKPRAKPRKKPEPLKSISIANTLSHTTLPVKPTPKPAIITDVLVPAPKPPVTQKPIHHRVDVVLPPRTRNAPPLVTPGARGSAARSTATTRQARRR